MKLPYLAFYILILALAGSGCRTQRAPVITTQVLTPAPSVVDKGTYQIKTRDRLLIRNLNWVSDLFPDPTAVQNGASEGFAVYVNSDGSIILPEVGRFPVAGLTRQALADTLSYLYKDVVRNPLFEVEVTNLRVKVLGSVNVQGIISLEQEYLSLGEVIAKSGGIKFTEAGGVIQIIRGEGTQQQRIEYDFQQLGDPLIMNQNIYDSDIVYVPPSEGSIKGIRFQRSLVWAQPLIITLNLTLIILNILRN
ncbi:MAG: polysaccharide biosynthesis/export family protein [Bacteroidetes bacterium]|nr:polysaccharide biosynthesis/export family protein [Bacteroidota bacterium]